jgi:hypothetical protein
MAEPVSISPLIGSVTGLYDSPLVKKFNNLGVLINTIGSTGTHEIKEIAARLELWGKDICGNSKTEDKIPSQVLQVLQEAFPDSALVKTIENNLDKIISVVERLADDSSDHRYACQLQTAVLVISNPFKALVSMNTYKVSTNLVIVSKRFELTTRSRLTWNQSIK